MAENLVEKAYQLVTKKLTMRKSIMAIMDIVNHGL